MSAPELFHGHGTVDLREAAALVAPETLATVIYTSGTTGPPKGVKISHFNVVYTAESLRRSFGDDLDLSGKRLVSYLPMAHIAERMTSHYSQVLQGYEVTSCPDPGLLSTYLKDVRPNIMFGVPRVWEKIHAGVSAALGADPAKKAQFDEGIAAAIPIALDRSWGRATAEQEATWDFLQAAAFGPVKELVGLDQVDFAITGAAPIPRELLEWYQGLGVPLSEIYGMSESSGPMTWTPNRIKPGTVGPAIPGCEVALADDGEIICRGGNVFEGYLNAPEKSPPRRCTTAGSTPATSARSTTTATTRSSTARRSSSSPPGARTSAPPTSRPPSRPSRSSARPAPSATSDRSSPPSWCSTPRWRRCGRRPTASRGARSTELADHPDVIAEVEKGLAEVMAGFNNAERVKKVKVLGVEWLPDSEELTPTSKLKRRGDPRPLRRGDRGALRLTAGRSAVAGRAVSYAPRP